MIFWALNFFCCVTFLTAPSEHSGLIEEWKSCVFDVIKGQSGHGLMVKKREDEEEEEEGSSQVKWPNNQEVSWDKHIPEDMCLSLREREKETK